MDVGLLARLEDPEVLLSPVLKVDRFFDYLAEAKGARVMPLTTVTRIRPLDGGGYEVALKFTSMS